MEDNVPVFYRAEEVAKILKCSKWWVQEEARNARLPHCRVAGSYRFTGQHLWEIAQILERAATAAPIPPADLTKRPRRSPRPASRVRGTSVEPASLTARVPTRARRAAEAA